MSVTKTVPSGQRKGFRPRRKEAIACYLFIMPWLLGFLIWNAKDWANIAQVIVGMLAISITVLALDIIYRLVERRLTPWRRNERRH